MAGNGESFSLVEFEQVLSVPEWEKLRDRPRLCKPPMLVTHDLTAEEIEHLKLELEALNSGRIIEVKSESTNAIGEPLQYAEHMQPRWIDVPAHRIYEVPFMRLKELFDVLDENGQPIKNDTCFMCVRKSDRKQFRPARFLPSDCQSKACYYLEEW